MRRRNKSWSRAGYTAGLIGLVCLCGWAAARPHAYMLRLPPGAARRNGVRWARLRAHNVISRRQALAQVISPAPILVLARQLNMARAARAQAQAAERYASQEAARLLGLYHRRQNASLKAVQAAQLALAGQRAALLASRRNLQLLQAGLRLQWGPVLARWLRSNSSNWRRVLAAQSDLVAVSLPENLRPPGWIWLYAPASRRRRLQARLISAFPRINSRIQLPSYLYLAPARAWLEPGLSLRAQFVQSARREIVAPAAAVIYWRGRGWIFVRLAPGRFQLRSLAGAGLAARRISARALAGKPVVVNGAGQLFSQWQKARVSAGASGD